MARDKYLITSKYRGLVTGTSNYGWRNGIDICKQIASDIRGIYCFNRYFERKHLLREFLIINQRTNDILLLISFKEAFALMNYIHFTEYESYFMHDNGVRIMGHTNEELCIIGKTIVDKIQQSC